MPRKLDLPSPKDAAAIQCGVERNPDNPGSGDGFFRDARPASAVLPPGVCADLARPRQGRPEAGPAKVQVMLLVDRDVFETLQASGPDWQAKANGALRWLAG